MYWLRHFTMAVLSAVFAGLLFILGVWLVYSSGNLSVPLKTEAIQGQVSVLLYGYLGANLCGFSAYWLVQKKAQT